MWLLDNGMSSITTRVILDHPRPLIPTTRRSSLGADPVNHVGQDNPVYYTTGMLLHVEITGKDSLSIISTRTRTKYEWRLELVGHNILAHLCIYVHMRTHQYSWTQCLQNVKHIAHAKQIKTSQSIGMGN